MGQCYSIELSLKLKDRTKAISSLNAKIARAGMEHCRYNLEGKDTDSLDDLLRVFLTDTMKFDGETYYSDFDASYGWESVLMDMFECLSDCLEDGSSIKIYPDSGCDHGVIENGKCVWR